MHYIFMLLSHNAQASQKMPRCMQYWYSNPIPCLKQANFGTIQYWISVRIWFSNC